MQKTRKSFWKRPLVRFLLIFTVQVAAFLIMAWLMDNVYLDSALTAVAVVIVIGILNALLWPILSYILVPFAVLTLGLVSLLLNGLMVWLAALIVPGFSVNDNFWTAFWLSLGMTAVNMILSSLLTIDDDTSWNRNQIKRRMKRMHKPEETDVPGIFFLEIDGLGKPILEKAIKEGYMPNLASWLESGSHVLTGWQTDTSSQTSASQAGILHGNNSEIPAFRWYDKASRKIIASSDTKILPEIEKEHSDGNGLLANDGASRGNLLSGDAKYVMTTASTITDPKKFHTSDFQAFFANPYNAARTLLQFIGDIIEEKREYRWARKNNIQPILDKHHRGGIYPLIRATMVVLMMNLNIYTLLGDLFAGRPSAYATFVGYDEIAHHSGITDPGAFKALRKLDKNFGRLASAIADAPRPYHLVVLSDHGQTGGATFLQRYGKSLQDFVQELMSADTAVGGEMTTDEGNNNLTVLLSDIMQNEKSGITKSAAKQVHKQVVKSKRIPTDEKPPKKKDSEAEHPDVYALASGNLGLISFTKWPERMTLEEINEAFPAVIPGLAQHEGIGFVMVRSEQNGPVVIGANGIYYLKDDRIEGENPLALFGPHAADHLRRTDSFSNCPDILVNSFYDPEKDEGCAFEELIGFHGGLGGTQTQPFILHPAELPVDGELVGAASIYHLAKGWLNALQNGASS